jgi:hypothetical protein
MSSSRYPDARRIIYLIKPIGLDGPVKVGITTNVPKRLLALNCMSPLPLEVLLAFEGNAKLERCLHAYFDDSHSHGEWFNWSERMKEFVASVKTVGFDTSLLPPGRRRKSIHLSLAEKLAA